MVVFACCIPSGLGHCVHVHVHMHVVYFTLALVIGLSEGLLLLCHLLSGSYIHVLASFPAVPQISARKLRSQLLLNTRELALKRNKGLPEVASIL